MKKKVTKIRKAKAVVEAKAAEPINAKNVSKLIRFRRRDFSKIQKLADQRCKGNVTEYITKASLGV
jgi:hypothetical protein